MMQRERNGERTDEANVSDQSPVPPKTTGGEDESSTEKDGDDSHLHEDQKSRTL